MIGTSELRRRQARPSLTAAHLRAIERALFALAIVLLGWYGLQQLATAYDQAIASRELETIRLPVNAPTPLRRDVLPIGSLVGRIEIPRVGLSAIVREGDDTATLRRAVGHIPETALPGDRGNAGLAGHRDTFFRGLKNVHVGDRVVLTTTNAVLHYVVRSTRVVEPTDVSVLNSTPRPTLTLVTCYPFYYLGAAPKRYIVQAEQAADAQQ